MKVRLVSRFTKLRDQGILVKRKRRKKKRPKRKGSFLARCRDCNQPQKVTRYDLFCRAAPPRCPTCGGVLDAPTNISPKHTGIIKPNPKTTRSASRTT